MSLARSRPTLLAAGNPRCLLGQERGAPWVRPKGMEAKGGRHPLEDKSYQLCGSRGFEHGISTFSLF